MERWAFFLSFFAVCVFVGFFSFSQQLGTSQRASIPWNKSFAFKMLPRIVWWDSLLSSQDWIHLRWIDLNWERLTWPIKEGLGDINLMIKTDLTLERLILPIERLSADKPAVLWWCTIVLPAGRRLCFKPVSRKVGRFAAVVCFCLMIQKGESKSCLLYNCCLVAALKSIHCLLAIRFIFPSGLLQIIDVLGVDWKEIEREVMSGIIMIIWASIKSLRLKNAEFFPT